MERKDLFDVVAVRGADALPFLHSQFAADLMSVEDGRLRWSALLNPQGRVLFVVAAVRLAVDEWRLLVPFARGAELVDQLRRFVFRRKLALALDAETVVTEGDAEGMASGIEDLRLGLARVGSAPALTDAALDRFVGGGLALIDATAAGRHLAHALRLDRFEAFSVKKGCYPGQEIVARTHFLGRNKRLLAEVGVGDAQMLASGTRLFDAEAEVGEIVCVGTTRALAVLTQDLPVGRRLGPTPSGSQVGLTRTYSPQS